MHKRLMSICAGSCKRRARDEKVKYQRAIAHEKNQRHLQDKSYQKCEAARTSGKDAIKKRKDLSNASLDTSAANSEEHAMQIPCYQWSRQMHQRHGLYKRPLIPWDPRSPKRSASSHASELPRMAEGKRARGAKCIYSHEEPPTSQPS